ncbi:hypothetical protein [Pseudoalteromonas phage J2-1_QLiu-2017]|nr:hypothetical protein [Pseudoalteromonas phage J2-1_QLiu-2017]
MSKSKLTPQALRVAFYKLKEHTRMKDNGSLEFPVCGRHLSPSSRVVRVPHVILTKEGNILKTQDKIICGRATLDLAALEVRIKNHNPRIYQLTMQKLKAKKMEKKAIRNPIQKFELPDIPQQTLGEVAVKSDGGSSSYYDFPVDKKLLTSLIDRWYNGESHIKTQELIEMFGSDFDFGTALKSLVRAYKVTRGGGKVGNDLNYELGKVDWYVNRIRERFSEVSSKPV